MKNVMISLLNSVFIGQAVDIKLTQNQLSELLKLAECHDLTHIVGYAMQKNNLLPKNEIGEAFEKAIFKVVYRYERNNFELSRICSTLEEGEIPYIPLKGAVVKDYYPEPWLRTSSDIDVLIKEADLEKACQLFQEKLDYKSNYFGNYDVSLNSKSGVHIELHYKLEATGDGNVDKVLANVWQRSHLKENTNYHYIMSDGMFYFYHLAHMYKHFKYAGCGVKMVLDTWLLEGLPFKNSQERDSLLQEAELLSFRKAILDTAKFWFSNGEINDTVRLVEKYIINSGTYGNIVNKAIASKLKKDEKISLINKLWKPYDELKYWYPSLQNNKILLPFYQIKRWFHIAFSGIAKNITEEKNIAENVDKNQLKEIELLFEKLEIK